MLVDVPVQNPGFSFLSSRRIVGLGVQSVAAKCPLPNEAGPFHTNLPWTLLIVAPTNHRGCEPPDALSQHSALGRSTKDPETGGGRNGGCKTRLLASRPCSSWQVDSLPLHPQRSPGLHSLVCKVRAVLSHEGLFSFRDPEVHHLAI